MSEEDDHKTACLPTRKFAGMEFDSETGNYYDYARFYSPRLGRFISPDPADLTAVDPTNPQSWNRYTYVLNNPTSFTDPLGLCGDNEMEDNGQCLPATPIGTSGTVSGGDTLNQVLFLLENGGSWGDNFGQVVGGGIAPNGPTTVPTQTTQQTPQSQGKQNLFSCAAGIGDKYSIAGGLHALGIGTSGVGGFITDALGGNAFSGATNLISSLGSGAAGGHNVFYNMAQGVVAGPGQGVLPPGVGGPWGASASGVATKAIAGTAWSSITGAGQTLTTLGGEASLASTTITAAEFASGVAEAKYAYDFLTYAGGAAACAVGLAH